jgi:undecaprenyl diphosphate synthase
MGQVAARSRCIARHLYQPDAPEVDLFLRPSGEQRTARVA